MATEKAHNKNTSKKTKIIITVSISIATLMFLGLIGFRHHPEKVIEAVTEYHLAVTHEEPAVTRTIKHPAVTRKEGGGCIRANIGNYSGNCATARCADGTYTGANPYYYLTCNYHGGVVKVGPFYYSTRTVTVKEAWTENIIDKPAKTVVDKEAWTEEISPKRTEPEYWTWYGMKI